MARHQEISFTTEAVEGLLPIGTVLPARQGGLLADSLIIGYAIDQRGCVKGLFPTDAFSYHNGIHDVPLNGGGAATTWLYVVRPADDENGPVTVITGTAAALSVAAGTAA